MKIIIQKKDINLRIISFIVYNIVYIFYMLGYLSRTMNLISLLLFSIICFLSCINKKQFVFVKELKRILFFTAIVFIISILRQMYYKDVNFNLLSGLLYVVLPMIDVFFIVNTSSKNEINHYLIIIFCKLVILFILNNIHNFSLSNILMINWSDSDSSVFESSMAHDFLFMVVVFKYLKKNKLSLISMIFCILCFKRFALICAVLFYFFYDYIFKKKEVSKALVLFTKIMFIITPFLVLYIVSENGQTMFYNLFRIPLNQFTTGRSYYINLVLKNMNYYNGYGSTHFYLSNIYGDTYVTSIHCDLLRLYLECGLISVIVCVHNWFSIIKNSRVLFYLMCYAFIEMFVSHFLEGMGIWMILYLFIYIVLYEKGDELDEGTDYS